MLEVLEKEDVMHDPDLRLCPALDRATRQEPPLPFAGIPVDVNPSFDHLDRIGDSRDEQAALAFRHFASVWKATLADFLGDNCQWRA